jgi:hypothetical protein
VKQRAKFYEKVGSEIFVEESKRVENRCKRLHIQVGSHVIISEQIKMPCENRKDVNRKNELKRLNTKFALVYSLDVYSLRTPNQVCEYYTDDYVTHLNASEGTAQEI